MSEDQPDPARMIPAVLANAARWEARLRAVPEGKATDATWAWLAYLETVRLNCAIGAPCAGLAPPLVPLEVALAPEGDRTESDPPT